jgi:cation diffusion facilitator CzcD-associated flavoprotein CzcO
MAQTAAHVTMLQRSPTYILAWPDTDIIANTLNKVLPAKIAYWIIRQKNIWMQQYFYQFSQRYPERTKANLLKRIATQLPPHIDVEKHFDPSYSPWEQRLCVSPNGDIFKALNNRSASVVTDHIQEFTEDGIALRSGDLLEADIIITATGLNLVIFGDVNFSIDEKAVDFSQTWSYKGVASSDIPNLFSCFGYINASWTLRADLTSEFLCRVINHMTETKTTQCTPRLRSSDQFMLEKPWIEGFNPGYIQRFSGNFPKQGDRDPWLNTQDYQRDKELLQRAPVEDDVLQFS